MVMGKLGGAWVSAWVGAWPGVWVVVVVYFKPKQYKI